MTDIDALVREAESLPFTGWDFAPIGTRWQTREPPWDLRAMVRDRLQTATSLLDIGTGGGEFLSSLQPLPKHTWATEGYEPNFAVARARLKPLGVRVLFGNPDQRIGLPSDTIDVVFDRHEAFDPREVLRVLRPGGTLITQQVGGRNYEGLHRRFATQPEPPYNHVESLDNFVEEVASSGLAVEKARDSRLPERFLDVGAVVYFLRAAPWEVPGFSVERHRAILEDIQSEIDRVGYWELEAHRLLIIANKTRK